VGVRKVGSDQNQYLLRFDRLSEVNDIQDNYFNDHYAEELLPLMSLVDLSLSGEQLFPPIGSSGFITKALSAYLLQFTINLFQHYFSPCMKYIFPLIAHKRQKFGLDFRACETWVVFPLIESRSSSNPPVPVGGAYWRLHKPKGIKDTHSYQNYTGVLEVLFLAVSSQHRNKNYGGSIVEKLKEVSRENKCQILYVEIGIETPQAIDFWTKYGFKEISNFNLSLSQNSFMEHNCLRFNDTRQYIWMDE